MDVHIVPMYKTKGPHVNEDTIAFNDAAASIRVTVEHAFGMLKGRWSSLRELRTQIRKTTDLTRAIFWISACTVLHNLLLDIEGEDFWEGMDPELLAARFQTYAAGERAQREE